MFIEPLRRNWTSASFTLLFSLLCDFTWLLPRARSPLYLWRILMKFRDALNSTGMVFIIIFVAFFCADLYQINHLINQDPLMYLVILYLNVFCPLVIPVILSEMNHTLTIANKPELNPV